MTKKLSEWRLTPNNSEFERLLAAPLEQFDKRSEILASIEAYSKAVPATVSGAVCGRHVDDPRASEDEQVAYDDVCIQLAQILQKHPAAPAGDGGLREALTELAKERDSVSGHTPGDYSIRPYELFDLLKAHPAAPAVPQPVDREALEQRIRRVYIDGGAHITHAQEAATEIVDAIMPLLDSEVPSDQPS